MATKIQNCYNTFVNNMLAKTGLPICEMQTLNEWVENRKIDFKDSSYQEKFNGFENWLTKKYL